MKALENNFSSEATVLITNIASCKTPNNEGFSALDFIFGKNIEQAKKALRNLLQNQEFEELCGYYSEAKIADIRRRVASGCGDLLKVHEVETVADTTMLSGTSEVMHSDELSKDDEIELKIREIHDKTIIARKRVEKLRRKNLKLKEKIKNSESSNLCLKNPSSSDVSFNNVVLALNTEIDYYSAWINSYQSASQPFFQEVYRIMVDKLRSFFGRNVKVSPSGSYENGLLMPWSDLNIIVTFFNNGKSEVRHRDTIIENAKKFSKILTSEISQINSCTIEERISLMIIKLQLSHEYRELNVEIIMKYYINPAYPMNEEIVIEYLKQYPMAKPLYLLFRTILHKAKLDDLSLDGIKSIVIVLIVVAYLQQNELSGNQKLKSIPLGQLFLNFLFYYSYTFDYFHESIQCYPVGHRPSHPIRPKDPRRNINSLMVINPYNDDIILTKSFKRTSELKQLIKLSYFSLFNSCLCTNTKIITLRPFDNLDSYKKCDKEVDNFGIYEDALGKFKHTHVNYDHKLVKKIAKRTLQSRIKSRKTVAHISFSESRVSNEGEGFSPTLCNPVSLVKMPNFILYCLFNFNFSSNSNI